MEKLGRNEKCHCGSGKKYKNCHWQEDQQISHPTIDAIIDDSEIKRRLSGYPDMPRPSRDNSFMEYAKSHDAGHIFNVLTGLQMIPENHGKNLRIEIMAREAMMLLTNCSTPDDYANLKVAISESYPMYHAEDPSRRIVH